MSNSIALAHGIYARCKEWSDTFSRLSSNK